MLSPFVPYPPDTGAHIRIHRLLRGLAERHDVDVLTLRDRGAESAAAADALRREGFVVHDVVHEPTRARTAAGALLRRRSLYGARFHSRELAQRLAALLAGDRYDAVQCEFAYMGAYAPVIRGASDAWLVLDEHNVEFELSSTLLALPRRGFRAQVYDVYGRRELRRRREEELSACRAVDRVLVASHHDRRMLERELPAPPVAVVPNGVDVDEVLFEPPAADAPARAVFVGTLDYRPNEDAVRWFCSSVLPLVRRHVPDFELEVVGARPSTSVQALARQDGVQIVGGVPDVRPHLRRAALTVVPLRAGSGTRLKILEAFAAGTPVVSTSLGCRGLDVVDGFHALVADDARDLAAAIVRLVREPATRKRLAAEARALVESRFSWSSAVAKLHDVYDSLPARSSARGAGTGGGA